MSNTFLNRDQVALAFRELYGGEPTFWGRAPGRVDLMGSHTDYNEGDVLTLTINRETWAAARHNESGQIRLASLNMDDTYTFDPNDPNADRLDGWAVYVQGVALTLRDSGYPVPGCDIVVYGTVPIGSGLSSSASLEAATAVVLEQLGGFKLDRLEMAKLCQRAENKIVGVQCGILDQYSSILGGKGKALVLNCRETSHRYTEFPNTLRTVICNTCAPRQLAGSEYGDRRRHCEEAATSLSMIDPSIRSLRDVSREFFVEHESVLPDLVAKRARFIVEEHGRVTALAEALANNDHPAIASITKASYEGARDLFEISVPAMDAMFQAMSGGPGVVGARQTGAGFGGCMVAVVQADQVEDFSGSVASVYESATGIMPEIYATHTAAGAEAM